LVSYSLGVDSGLRLLCQELRHFAANQSISSDILRLQVFILVIEAVVACLPLQRGSLPGLAKDQTTMPPPLAFPVVIDYHLALFKSFLYQFVLILEADIIV